MADYRLIAGDALEILQKGKEKSIQTCITSPPYFGLRSYGGGEKEIGSNQTLDQYIESLVCIFRAVRRVLRDDGTLWLNLGDSYNGSGGSTTTKNFGKQYDGKSGSFTSQPRDVAGLKPKDLVGVPWRAAFALQADGWWLRSDIVWAKPAPVPESVKDRPTRSHEYVFLLTKNKSYYYDYEAIKEEAAESSLKRIAQKNFANQKGGDKDYRNGTNPNRSMRQTVENFAKNPGRNKRDVWVVPSASFREAHFATFPPALIEPMILAGTSERGACARCGSPWQRVIAKEGGNWEERKDAGAPSRYGMNNNKGEAITNYGMSVSHTVGWQPTCNCGCDETRPCWVLDPFCGSGTTAVVALKHGRRFVGIDLKPEYIDMSERRIQKEVYNRK